MEDLFDFSIFNENYELFGNKNRKVIGKFEKKLPKYIWIVEFICLRSKKYAFNCRDDSDIN